MSGLVCVLPITGDQRAVANELTALAKAFEKLPGETCPTVTPYIAGAVVEVATNGRGWTVVHGVAHGARPSPVTLEDLSALDGQCAVVSHNAGTGRVLLATDRFGTAPLHVAERNGLLYVSTSALVLAAHLRVEADPRAVAAFLVAGYQFGAQTHWQGIRRLEPGVCVEVYNGRTVETEYWRPAADPAVEALSLSQAADHLIEVATETYRERLRAETTWIDLTGGHDSRMMALLLERAGVPFEANTRSSSMDPDLELASELATLKGWSWQPVTIPDDWPTTLADELDGSLAAGDALLEVLQLSHVAWAHRRLAPRHIPRCSAPEAVSTCSTTLGAQSCCRKRNKVADLGRWAV